jgi:hypothetical protein
VDRRVWQVLALHLAVLVANGMLAVAHGAPRQWNSLFTAWFYAVPLAQVAMASAWCVLAPERLSRRLPLTCLIFAIVDLGADLPLALYSAEPDAHSNCLLLAIEALAMMLVFLPLRLRGRWALGRPAPESPTALAHRWQFGIRDILLWTTAVAATLGLGRLLLANRVDLWPRHFDHEHTWLGIAALAMLMLIAGRTAYVRRGRRHAMLTAARDWLLVTAGQAVLAYQIPDPPWPSNAWILNGMAFLVTLGSLLLLPSGGWAERRPPAEDERSRIRKTALGLAVVVYLLSTLGEVFGPAAFGLYTSLATLLAVGFALGRTPFTERLLSVVWFLLGLAIWSVVHGAARGHGPAVSIVLSLSWAWLWVQLPLWALRIRWSVVLATSIDVRPVSPLAAGQLDEQRALIRTLGWTALVGHLAWFLITLGEINAQPMGVEPYVGRFSEIALRSLQAMLLGLAACALLAPQLTRRLILAAVLTCLLAMFGPAMLLRSVLMGYSMDVTLLPWEIRRFLPLLGVLFYLRALAYRLNCVPRHRAAQLRSRLNASRATGVRYVY